ncbi:MAG: T9SS type A sorting domain-containing protein, partial [Candidatus Krumholzibacteria bacterium]|nr:T9SS type A sorting domain-containing protein [Candidatus Krumholzibacteria bacterium]
DTLSVTATIPFDAQYGTGEAYVYLAPGRTTITQPVVVVEGFDLDDTMNWDELYALLNDEGLVESLRADGYDAVVLNFADATDYMQRNAFVLVALIEQVQAMLPAQARFALVGASMGGLVGRYALAYMETNAIAHRVSLFMTFDSPHAGANIPLGIQYWLDFFSGESADAAFLLSRLDTPAARQMLVYHHTTPPSGSPSADPLRAVFAADLATVGGYPSQPRRVAVANGSATMQNQGFAAGDQIIAWEYNTFLVDITGNVWAVPDGGSTRIFEGLIWVFLIQNESLDVTVSGTLPYDNAPGGSRASMADMDSVAAPYGDIVALHERHCFIPTVSALDLATSDLFYDIAGDPNLLALTPFDAVFFPVGNEPHVDITPENAAWILGEIEGMPTAVRAVEAPAARLAQNHPNPFNPQTAIRFALPGAARVTLAVYDARGRHVATLFDDHAGPGEHIVRWDGRGQTRASAPSGVYFCRLVTPWGTLTRKMVLLR